jgi:plastocyanin
MRLLATLLLAGTFLYSGAAAIAEEYTISQKKKRFRPKVLNVKVGDTLKFINDDRYAHNLFSKSKGHKFEVRKKMPGQSYVLKLTKPGSFDVRCVIHPRMKMTVNVK